MPPFVGFTEVLGKVLIVVDSGAFWLYLMAFTFTFAVAIPWLVNRPQPKPSPALWEDSEADRKHRRGAR